MIVEIFSPVIPNQSALSHVVEHVSHWYHPIIPHHLIRSPYPFSRRAQLAFAYFSL